MRIEDDPHDGAYSTVVSVTGNRVLNIRGDGEVRTGAVRKIAAEKDEVCGREALVVKVEYADGLRASLPLILEYLDVDEICEDRIVVLRSVLSEETYLETVIVADEKTAAEILAALALF